VNKIVLVVFTTKHFQLFDTFEFHSFLFNFVSCARWKEFVNVFLNKIIESCRKQNTLSSTFDIMQLFVKFIQMSGICFLTENFISFIEDYHFEIGIVKRLSATWHVCNPCWHGNNNLSKWRFSFFFSDTNSDIRFLTCSLQNTSNLSDQLSRVSHNYHLWSWIIYVNAHYSWNTKCQSFTWSISCLKQEVLSLTWVYTRNRHRLNFGRSCHL